MAALLALLLAAVPAVCSATDVADWPQMGRTMSFGSYKDVAIPKSPPHAEYTWVPPTGLSPTRLVASPAVWDSVVYLGSDDGHLYAIDQKTGQQKWKFAQKCMPAKSLLCGGNGIRSSPAVDTSDGSIAFGSYDKHVYKLSSVGKLLWATKTGGGIYGPATIDGDGTVYVGTMHGDNCLYALHGKTGELKWKQCANKARGELNSGATIGAPGGPAEDVIVANNFDGVVRGYDRSSGKIMWTHNDTGTGGGGSAVIAGRTVFIGSWDRNLYSLDALTGHVNWAFNASGEIESHPAFHDGVVYFSAEESKTIWALNASTSEKIWSYSSATEEINGSPTVTRSYVSVGANDGFMHVLKRGTGELLFKIATDCGEESHVFSSAAVGDNGMMYFTCNTGTARRRRAQLSEGDSPGVGKFYSINPALHMK